MKKKLKILIVDDSVLVRNALQTVFDEDPELEVVAAVNDPYEAAHALRKVVPDVITLDIEMPKMDGLTFLKKLMKQHPIPVVIISTLTQKGTEIGLRALELGAAEILAKPKINTKSELLTSAARLCTIVKAASNANLNNLPLPGRNASTGKRSIREINYDSNGKILAYGASTGGTEALKLVLQKLPKNCPGVLVVQHMPVGFTNQFARRLDEECEIKVKEAKNGDLVVPGQALIAPGDKHMLLKRRGLSYFVDVREGPLVSRHMPSVDVLFKSVARYAGANAAGALLTGMGRDGANGLLEMKQSGAYTVAQNEATSVVFGMPKEAIKNGAAMEVLALDQVSEHMLRSFE